VKATTVATILLLALVVLTGCGDPKNAVITKDNWYKALDDVGPQLSDDERRELIEAHARSVFGKYSIEGKTINQVLSEQKKFDDDKTAPLFGSWTCSVVFGQQAQAYPKVRAIFTFNPNHNETVLFTGPKPQRRPEHYHFGFDGSTLDEENQWGYNLDSINLSGGILRIDRAVQKFGSNEPVTVMWPDVFTCRRV